MNVATPVFKYFLFAL